MTQQAITEIRATINQLCDEIEAQGLIVSRDELMKRLDADCQMDKLIKIVRGTLEEDESDESDELVMNQNL
jgi:hypothetical protein